MQRKRIHRAVSGDGVEIAGRIDGQGPPLVLVHGSLEDGELCWRAMLPSLCRRFTCYLPSTRGRGLSGESEDLAPERRVGDIIAFVESIGEPVSLFGESDGGTLALGAAADSDAVSAVAAYEPVVFEVAGQDIQHSLEETLPRVAQAVTDDRLTDAARIFSELVANDEELSALAESGHLDEAGRYMPILLQELQQDGTSPAPSATAASSLTGITVPTLLLHGARGALRHWFHDGVRHVAEHIADVRVREVPRAGHFGVALEPEAISDELSRFLEDVSQPA